MMRRSLNILLVAILVAGAIPGISFAFTNPLQKYNLYEDTHRKGAGRQGVMSESFYNIPNANSTSTYNPAANSVPSTAQISTKPVPTASAPTGETDVEQPQRRKARTRDKIRVITRFILTSCNENRVRLRTTCKRSFQSHNHVNFFHKQLIVKEFRMKESLVSHDNINCCTVNIFLLNIQQANNFLL